MEDKTQLPQKDGQLMGSISSFPFLCLANAALCRLSLEYIYGKRISLKECPLLINGDDCTMCGLRTVQHPIYRGNLNLRFIWSKITNYAGLTSSDGKTLFSLPHKPIVVINSMTFDWCFEQRKWVERKFVPLGIMLNKPRSGLSGDSSQREYAELGSLHRELESMCPLEVWPEVSDCFIKNVKPILNRCPNIPWYCPEYLGGPGLCPKKDKNGIAVVSKHDRKLFTWMIMNLNKSGPKPQKARSLREWAFHDKVLESYKDMNVKETTYLNGRYDAYGVQAEFNMDKEADRLYGLKVVESLFRNSIGGLYEKKEKDSDIIYQKSLLRSEKANMRFHQTMAASLCGKNHIEIRSWEELKYRTISANFPVAGTDVYECELAIKEIDAWLADINAY